MSARCGVNGGVNREVNGGVNGGLVVSVGPIHATTNVFSMHYHCVEHQYLSGALRAVQRSLRRCLPDVGSLRVLGFVISTIFTCYHAIFLLVLSVLVINEPYLRKKSTNPATSRTRPLGGRPL